MKKILPGLILFSAFIHFQSQGQKGKMDLLRLKNHPINNLAVPILNACDSISWPFQESEGVTWYILPGDSGYLSGNNYWEDKAKGNFYDMSASSALYINRVILGLGPVNAKSGGVLTAVVNVKVYDGTSNTPGALLGTYNSTLQEMRNRRLNFSFIVFSPAIQLPASKKIFLVLEYPTITWNVPASPSINDTITLLSTELNKPAVSIGWEQWSNNSWHSILTFYGQRLNHHIYPIVSETTDGCNTLPVTFGSFSAKIASSGVDLDWQTWTEMNNHRFEVERSTDALKFTSVGTVLSKAISGNHQGQLNYQFTDANPAQGINYYRIRQIDKDESSAFTKVVKIAVNGQESNNIIRNYYPNPASDKLFIQLGAGIREVETVRFTDASGKILGTQKPAVSPDGVLNVSTRSLRSGLSFATVILPDGKQTTIKVMKD